MNGKFTPTLTKGKIYELSLIGINQKGTRCDLIYSYIDDDGDTMFLREFTETINFTLKRPATWNRGNCHEILTRTFRVRGAYRFYDKLDRVCLRAKLALSLNGATGRYYTVIAERCGLSSNWTMPEETPSYWLTDEYYYGPTGLSMLDARKNQAMYMAEQSLEELADYYESGNYERDMEAVMAEA